MYDSVYLVNNQLAEGCIILPDSLTGFRNTKTVIIQRFNWFCEYHVYGHLADHAVSNICPHCGAKGHIHDHHERILTHESKGLNSIRIHVQIKRYKCPHCGKTFIESIPFEQPGYRITRGLYKQVVALLEMNAFTLKHIAKLTGLHPHTVKRIDKERLLSLYTEGGKALKRPEQKARRLGIDEFKLHNGHQYATHIIDLDTGYIIWIAFGKKKQVVYDFINHVGLEWMKSVEAVTCDMNASFVSPFEEMCPWIQIVYDRFHIIKNFNDKVISQIRRSEQKRLMEEGRVEDAKLLKRCRYIMVSSKATLQEKDKKAEQGEILPNGSVLFDKEARPAKSGRMERYQKLLSENELFFTIDVVKDLLDLAFETSDQSEMADLLNKIIDTCRATENVHFLWFANMLEKHWRGIITHSVLKLSNGKIEGINNRIKTVRRMGYGYADDEYFFLKLMDMSRHSPKEESKSPTILH